jgi:hypothetical protein
VQHETRTDTREVVSRAARHLHLLLLPTVEHILCNCAARDQSRNNSDDAQCGPGVLAQLRRL